MEALIVLAVLILLVLLCDPLQVFARGLGTVLVMIFWLLVAAALGLVAGIVYAAAVVVIACAEATRALHDLRTRRRHARWLKTHQVPR